MSEKVHDHTFQVLLRKGGEEALLRLKQSGDAHHEQLLMSYLGYELKLAREREGISVEVLADKIPATERSIQLGEMGLLGPERFFVLLEKWAPSLNVSIQSLTAFFESSMQGPRRLRDI